MDWARAKTILIIALVMTIVFLVVAYGNFGQRTESFSDYEALSEFLAQKNIHIDAEIIPREESDMPTFFVQLFQALNFQNGTQSTIPASEALLLFLAQMQGGESINITSMEMVNLQDEAKWKITLHSGEERFVSAY